MVPAIPERCWSALWHILAGCGLRPGEALALRWQEIDEVGQKLRVRRNLIRVPGSKGYQLLAPKTKKSKREVPIPAPVWNELKRSRKVQKHQRMHSGEAWQDAGFVLTNSKGGPLHDVRRAFERVSARAGLGEWGEEPKREHVTGPVPKRQFTPAFRIYDCRHTYVTLLLMAGTPVNVVADLVGHEKASFTIARLRSRVAEANEGGRRDARSCAVQENRVIPQYIHARKDRGPSIEGRHVLQQIERGFRLMAQILEQPSRLFA